MSRAYKQRHFEGSRKAERTGARVSRRSQFMAVSRAGGQRRRSREAVATAERVVVASEHAGQAARVHQPGTEVVRRTLLGNGRPPAEVGGDANRAGAGECASDVGDRG